jgi:predicted flap endonuclease-1-like 5' DNA nuclease
MAAAKAKITKTRTVASSTTEPTYQELYEETRRRLGMLWKAFEDAEARIAELEAQVTRLPDVVTTTVVKEPELEPVERYPVKLAKLTRIPGLGKQDADRLREYGVNVTDELLYADLEKLSHATGIAPEKLTRWRDVCELMAVPGIGPKWAGQLVDAGVTSERQLAKLTPEELEATLMASYEAQGLSAKKRQLLQRTLPSRCKRLTKAAKRAVAQL